MDYRKIIYLPEFYFMFLIGAFYLIEKFKRKNPRYLSQRNLIEYNESLKTENGIDRMIIGISMVLILGSIVAYFRFELRYLYYPFFNLVFGIIVFIISCITTFFLLRCLLIKNKQQDLSKTKRFILSLGTSISISLLFGCLQFFIYFGDKESFKIDDDVLGIQVKTDTIEFNNQAAIHFAKSKKSKDLKGLFSDSLQYSVEEFRGSKTNRGFVFTSRANGFEFIVKRHDVDIFIVAPWGPPAGSRTLKDLISIEVWYDEIHLQQYLPISHRLNRFVSDPSKFNTQFLRGFCDTVAIKEKMFAEYILSKKEIAKTGNLTWDVFGINSIMASFGSNPGYNKPIKIWTMILSMIQVILVVSVMLPSIIPVLDFSKEH